MHKILSGLNRLEAPKRSLDYLLNKKNNNTQLFMFVGLRFHFLPECSARLDAAD